MDRMLSEITLAHLTEWGQHFREEQQPTTAKPAGGYKATDPAGIAFGMTMYAKACEAARKQRGASK